MNSFQLPRNPDDLRKPSVVDAQGNNPFADDLQDAAPAPESDDAFASPAQNDDQPPYRPHGYIAALPHRGRLILGLSLAGIVGAFVSVLVALDWYPLAFANLALTLPPCLMAYVDLRAIKAGAMDPAGQRLTRIGFWLGLAGSIVSLLTAALLIAAPFLDDVGAI